MKRFKYFPFPEIFEFKRGVRFTEDEHIPGNVAYISSSKDNNGVNAYVTPPFTTKKNAKLVIYRNCLTISNSGSVGYLFYHDYDFIASDHVTVFWPKTRKLTKNIALYLKPILEKIRYKYNFGREISDSRLKKEKIYLPVDNEGNPDWNYMEDYIQKKKNNVFFHNITSKQNVIKSFSRNSWQEFKLMDIFHYERGTRLTKADRIIGDIPLVTAGYKNYGISEMISNSNMSTFKDSITIDMFGNVFWKEGSICCDDNIIALYPMHCNLNKYIAIFLVSVLKKLTQTFNYGRQYRLKHFLRQSILLPAKTVNSNNQKTYIPDWSYMENYIKSLPYADLI